MSGWWPPRKESAQQQQQRLLTFAHLFHRLGYELPANTIAFLVLEDLLEQGLGFLVDVQRGKLNATLLASVARAQQAKTYPEDVAQQMRGGEKHLIAPAHRVEEVEQHVKHALQLRGARL